MELQSHDFLTKLRKPKNRDGKHLQVFTDHMEKNVATYLIKSTNKYVLRTSFSICNAKQI